MCCLVLPATGASGHIMTYHCKSLYFTSAKLRARELSPFPLEILANSESCTKSSTAACSPGTAARPSAKSQLGAHRIVVGTIQGYKLALFGTTSVSRPSMVFCSMLQPCLLVIHPGSITFVNCFTRTTHATHTRASNCAQEK
jgi:hypothetical protein